MDNRKHMRTEKKTAVKNSFGRLLATGIFVLIQVAWLAYLLLYFYRDYAWISLLSTFIAIILVLKIYGTSTNSAMKMPWIIVILAFPILGILIYLLFGRSIVTRAVKKRFNSIEESYKKSLSQDENILKEVKDKDIYIYNQFHYLSDHEGYPVYKNTDIEFYSIGEEGLEAQLKELEKAEKFIFMEYHAIEEASSFDRIKDVLIKKAAAGVEVRLFYDDVGSIFFLNKDFIKEMRANGIDCRVFNPIKLAFNMFMNNRDHRKITVIDGKVGFTGGYNLADEYFNITHPYGEWKDTGLKLTGDAVKTLTMLFLSMWNSIKKTDEPQDDYIKYIKASDYGYKAVNNNQYVVPYADSPLNNNRVAENVYLNVIKGAKHYLYITTPYLLITEEMSRELAMAAMRGVDVRIVTPGIPDKKLTYSLTRSYYADLVRYGVRIYEYTPGFIHAKQWVSDGEVSVVGTINMDFRSLYLHFENAEYIKGREHAPKGVDWDKAVSHWKTLKSDDDAVFDKEIRFDAADIQPMITYGTNPGMGMGITEHIPVDDKSASFKKSLDYMGFQPGESLLGKKIDYVFLGACTNGRIEDFRAFTSLVRGKKKADHVTAWLVPGSWMVDAQIREEGLDKILEEAGFAIRQPGCSACLAMNDDKIPAGKYSVSTSNRNFEGRQGPGARTLLASPLVAAAAAVTGVITDPRELI